MREHLIDCLGGSLNKPIDLRIRADQRRKELGKLLNIIEVQLHISLGNVRSMS